MNKEEIIYRNDFIKEIWENSQRFCKEEGTDAPQYVEVDKIFEIVEKYKDKEIERLNDIIERIDSFVDRTITVIEQQPTGNDEWILERLNGIKYLTKLKEGVNNE